MSSGACTMRQWLPISSQRTPLCVSGVCGREKCVSSCASSQQRSNRRCKSGPSSATLSSAARKPSSAVAMSAKPLPHSSASTPSGAVPSQRRRAWLCPLFQVLPRVRRCSRVVYSRVCTNSCQSTKPRALARPVAKTSRQKSSNWVLARRCPKNCTPVSLSWCASSKITISVCGSNCPKPSSFSAISANSRWWLMTTISACMAWLRALARWQLS